MLGAFAHTVYLRFQLTGFETYEQLLNLIRREFTEAMLHRDFGRAAHETPDLLWRSVFTYVPWSLARLAGVPTPTEQKRLAIAVEPFNYDPKCSTKDAFIPPFDIDVSLFEGENDTLSGYALYRPRIVDGSWIREFVFIFDSILRLLVSDQAFYTRDVSSYTEMLNTLFPARARQRSS